MHLYSKPGRTDYRGIVAVLGIAASFATVAVAPYAVLLAHTATVIGHVGA